MVVDCEQDARAQTNREREEKKTKRDYSDISSSLMVFFFVIVCLFVIVCVSVWVCSPFFVVVIRFRVVCVYQAQVCCKHVSYSDFQ